MTKNMFCPKCGADGQSADSYCTRCGEWLPDLAADTTTFVNRSSVVENTTELLEPLPRETKRDAAAQIKPWIKRD